MAIAPDGTWLATTSGDQTVRIWAADGTLRATLTGHAAPLFQRVVQAVAIAPDGTWLATASWDKTARIWAADGTPRATLTGHKSPVDRGGDRPGRHLAGHHQRRSDGADLGRRLPPSGG